VRLCQWPDPHSVALATAFAVLSLVLGATAFFRAERRFYYHL